MGNHFLKRKRDAFKICVVCKLLMYLNWVLILILISGRFLLLTKYVCYSSTVIKILFKGVCSNMQNVKENSNIKL